MDGMDAVSLTAGQRVALEELGADLRQVFGARLHSLAAYGLDGPAPAGRLVHTLALVDRLSFEDLTRCAPLAADWRRRSLAVPLILERDEFLRTLDVFPLEYGDIIASHIIVAGSDPFASARVSAADVRRACELSAKGHLIHLREAFMESGAEPQAVGRLIAASAPTFSALLRNIARLAQDDDSDVAVTAERQIGIPASVVREVMSAGAGTQSTIAEPTVLLSRYIAAAERVWEYVDTWRARA
jgi:hypothetical protein